MLRKYYVKINIFHFFHSSFFHFILNPIAFRMFSVTLEGLQADMVYSFELVANLGNDFIETSSEFTSTTAKLGERGYYEQLGVSYLTLIIIIYSEKNTIKIFTVTWNKIQVHILLIFYKEQAYLIFSEAHPGSL